jgi:putative ABC transport system permease protein
VLLEGGKQPSIERIAASTGLPFGIQPAYQSTMALPGSDRVGAQADSTALIAATPSLLPVLGIPIVRGRGLSDADDVSSPAVAVISELTAAQMFRQTDPIGQTLLLTIGKTSTTVTIVGVSRDTDVRSMRAPRRPLIVVPLAQHFDRDVTISARAAGRPAAAVTALRDVVRAADPDLVVDISGEGRSVLSGAFEILRSMGRGALYLGTFTLLLSMVGLFGVQSHVVMYRRREFGVRLSLGATARQIKTMVMRDGARPVFDGLVLGLWGGIAGRFIIRAYADLDVAVLDPWMLLLAPVPIVMAALCACYFPAVTASRVDPTTALRCE